MKLTDLIPPGHVAIPQPGAAHAGFVTHHCGGLFARDPKWFNDCAGYMKPRFVRRWIRRHHDVVTNDEYWRRVAATMPPFVGKP